MNKDLCGTVFGSCNPRSDTSMLAGLCQSRELRLNEMVTRRSHRLRDFVTVCVDLS